MPLAMAEAVATSSSRGLAISLYFIVAPDRSLIPGASTGLHFRHALARLEGIHAKFLAERFEVFPMEAHERPGNGSVPLHQEHRRDMRQAVGVAGGVSVERAVEQRGHGDAELAVKFARGVSVVLRDREHAGAPVHALIDALEERERELARGAGNLEEGQENRSGFQQVAERFFAAGQVLEPELGSALPSGERLVLSRGSHNLSVNRGDGVAQKANRVQAHSSWCCWT